MADPGKRGLTPEEQRALATRIGEPDIEASQPVEKPNAILTGGQPGAGKSAIKTTIGATYQSGAGIVVVDPDDIRPQLDYMRPLIAAGTETVPDVANEDAGTVAYLIVQDAKAGKRNVLVDGTLQNTSNAVRLANELRKAGYCIELHGMAVYPDLSHARTYARREDEMANSPTGFGRSVDDAYHEGAVEGFARTVEVFYEGRHVDRIALYNEAGARVLDIWLDRKRGTWSTTQSPVDVLHQAHMHPTEETKAKAASTWALAAQAMHERGADMADVAKVEQFHDTAAVRVGVALAEPSRTYTGPIE